MKKHLLKTLLLFTFLFSGLVSCDLFYPEYSVREYLYEYSNASIPSDPEPMGSFAYDKNHNLCIPSDQDYFFRVYMTNPNDETHFDFKTYLPADERGSHDYDEETQNLIEQNKIRFIYNYNTTGPYVFYIQFDKDYLKSKDTEGQRDFLTCILLKAQIWDPERGDYVDKAGPVNTPFPFKFTVNSLPDIIVTDEGDYNPTFGTYRDSNDDEEYQFLCFNLKDPNQYDNIYADLKTASNGHYIININNKDYTFFWNSSTGKFVFDDADSFITKKPSSSELSIVAMDYSEFKAGSYPVYFLTKSKELSAFNVNLSDTSELKQNYTFSTAPSGKYQLNNPGITRNQDLVTITPNFNATNLSNNGSLDTSKVYLKYKLKESDDWTEKECTSTDDKVEIYLPGGDTTIYYKQTGMSSDWKPTVEKSETFNMDKIVYVSSSPEKEEYNGAIKSHPCSLKKAFNTILKNQKAAWTCYLVDSVKANSTSDFTSGSTDFISLTNNNQGFSLTIKSESSSNHKTIDANTKGRVIHTSGFNLTLVNLNITGGNASSGNGGAVLCDKTLTINYCDFYSNKAKSNGGAVYAVDTLSINYGVFYSNQAENGGAIYFSNKTKTMTLENSEIGRAGYTNQASQKGGGIFISSDSTSQIKSTTIGVKDINAIPSENKNFGNSAANGGGLYYENYSTNKTCSIKFYSDTNICGNLASSCGGGVYCNSGEILVDKVNTSITIHHNKCTSNGGGVYLAGASYLSAGYIINNNNANNNGGGICMIDSSSIKQGQITNNTSNYRGGGIFFNSTGSISSTSSSDVYNNNGTINSSYGVLINNNTATDSGGGIYITPSSAFTLQHCEIKENISPAGAGIYTDQDTTITYCHIAGNKKDANNAGEGIRISEKKLTFTNKLNINTNNSIYLKTVNSNHPTLEFPSNDSIKPDFYNTSLKVDADFSNKQVITTTQVDTYYSKIVLVPTTFTSVVFDSKLMVISNDYVVSDNKSLQTIINSIKDTAFLDSPGIILFTKNITEKSTTSSNNYNGLLSTAVFRNSGSEGAKRKYLVIGNGYTYDANRKSSYPGSAIAVEKDVTVDIYNLQIKGGYAQTSTWSTGGGIYTKGNVYLKKNTYVGKPSHSPCAYTESDIQTSPANKAGKGGGVYVANGGYLEVDETSSICGNQIGKDTNGVDVCGGGLYVESGGFAKFIGSVNSKAKICYNLSTYGSFGAAVYTETNGEVSFSNTEIHDNWLQSIGVPGIYLCDKAIFYAYNLVMHDNTYSGVPYDSDDLFGSAIHCAGGLFIDTTSTNSSCPGAFAYLNLYSNDGVDFYLPKGIKKKGESFSGSQTYDWWYGLFGSGGTSSLTPSCTFMAGYGTGDNKKKIQFTANSTMDCNGGSIKVENYITNWTP
ncbi:MAG: right-handed parallel beta-helix repeat-containing protein [Treponema sp.]|nr:right-handed parallel beta-helix repeat-containing protein [Treponema sp.]